jgi:hypothetical protein
MQRQGREEWPELVLGAHMKKAKDQYQFFSVALLAPLALWHPYVGIKAKEGVRESPFFFNLPGWRAKRANFSLFGDMVRLGNRLNERTGQGPQLKF